MNKTIIISLLLLVIWSCQKKNLDLPQTNDSQLEAVAIKRQISNRTINFPDNYDHNSIAHNWMKHLDDNTPLINLSLVGSHDTGAYVNGGSLTICQQDDIMTQLQTGVRYLDIRLNVDHNKLVVYHGIISQNLTFDGHVLSQVFAFLDKNPSETVFIVLKNENGKNQTDWEHLIKNTVNQNPQKFVNYINHTTTIKDTRGKIILLSRSGLSDFCNTMTNIRYNNASFAWLNQEPMFFSDKFKVPSLFDNDINNKATVIFDGIYKAQKLENKTKWMIINANGTSVFAHPKDIANRINPMIANYLQKHIYQPYNFDPPTNFIVARSGFLILDFSTSDSAKQILNLMISQSIKTNNTSYIAQNHLNVNYIP